MEAALTRLLAYAHRIAGALIVATALCLGIVGGRWALASGLLWTPDVPNPSLPSEGALPLDRALELAPSNAVYRYWRAQELHAGMRARWLDGDQAESLGKRALDEASRAVELLRNNPYFHLLRAWIELDLARHPATTDPDDALLTVNAATDLETALDLRERSPILVNHAADLALRHWERLRGVRPELPLRAVRLSAGVDRLGTPERLSTLWRTLASQDLDIESAVELMESGIPADVERAQRQLARLFAQLAREGNYPNTPPERTREILEQAAGAATVRADEAAVEGR